MIASLLGNAAAHAALLPENAFAQKEAALYSSDAADAFLSKRWNKGELDHLKRKALARAKSEIRSRIEAYGFDEKHFEKFAGTAEEFIDSFIAQAQS